MKKKEVSSHRGCFKPFLNEISIARVSVVFLCMANRLRN